MTLNDIYGLVCAAYLILFTIPLAILAGHATLTFLAFWFRFPSAARAIERHLAEKSLDETPRQEGET